MLRRLHDGRIGAEYMGLVYPLAGADAISLNAQWCYPSEAPICLEPVELAPSGRKTWSLERLASRSYLFLNGSAGYLERVVGALQGAGIAPEHWGPSFREDPQGVLYDWFIRFPRDEAEPTTHWELDQLLGAIGTDDDEDESELPLRDQLARARRLIDAVLRRQAEAERQLSDALGQLDAQALANAETARLSVPGAQASN